jgi:hypothetical protein
MELELDSKEVWLAERKEEKKEDMHRRGQMKRYDRDTQFRSIWERQVNEHDTHKVREPGTMGA